LESGAKEVKDMAQSVIAEVILRKADGSSVLDAQEPITARNIAQYRVGEEVAEKASRKLQDGDLKSFRWDPRASPFPETKNSSKTDSKPIWRLGVHTT